MTQPLGDRKTALTPRKLVKFPVANNTLPFASTVTRQLHSRSNSTSLNCHTERYPFAKLE
ncbi:hypothetical protein QUB05_19360 [Microcoleus sp. F10-C6]|uniref:hypothetical protein n=1 Tax=unclassified Microcoleus TaxID=2642155 RepID=UPI002FCF842F